MKKVILALLCALMVFAAVMPAFALESEKTNENEITIEWDDMFGENAGAPDEAPAEIGFGSLLQ